MKTIAELNRELIEKLEVASAQAKQKLKIISENTLLNPISKISKLNKDQIRKYA